MDALLLGSGGWIPTVERETCCLYLREGARVLLIDAGTGLQRLAAQPELLDGVDALDIVLTHFHLDHVVGLSYAPALPLRPTIWGGGERLAGVSTRSILERFLGSPLFASGPSDLFAGVHELQPEGQDLGPFPVTTRVQRNHPDPTLAVRIGDVLTYCTDTARDEANAEFTVGTRMLLHEAWHAAATTDDRGHSAAGEAGAIAKAAAVDELILIHVNPLLLCDEDLEGPARDVFARSQIGRDLQPLAV